KRAAAPTHFTYTPGPAFLPAGPVRLLDTRPAFAVGPNQGPPAQGQTLRVTMPTHQALGLPGIAARAYALSVTATAPNVPGYVTVWRCGDARPDSSNLNVTQVGQTVANLVVTRADGNRDV